MKNTKTALLTSVIALLLCVSMLVGTTFAWFTDTASTGVNKIQAGNLDIQIVDENDVEITNLEWVAADGRAQDQILWEPGARYELEPFKIKNNGSLALKYKMQITGIVGDAKLLEVIDFTYTTSAGDFDINAEHTLGAGELTELITVKGVMKETAGNEYQGLFIDGISITVVATQVESEFDSFGNDYDANAVYPVSIGGVASTTGTTWKSDIFELKAANNAVPAGTRVVIEEASTPASITISGDKIDVTYDISLVDAANKKVTVATGELIELNVNFGEQLKDVEVYHKGVAVTKGNASTPAAETFVYDETTGVVTMWVDSFSPFTFVLEKYTWEELADTDWYKAEEKEFTLTTAEQLAGLAQLAKGGNNFSGKTIVLGSDIDLKNREWTPINGFVGTFDGDGKTISNLHVDGGETGKGFGLFGDSNVKELKNLTIHNAYVYGNSAVAAAIGNGFTSTITNVHVTGLIRIGTTTKNGHIANYNSSYIGGIIGWGYAKISNCSVTGDEGSIIGGGRQAGGILGFGGEGKADRVVDCSVSNVTISGTKSVGGIIGWAHYGNNVKNCTVSDVTIAFTGTDTSTIGLITGTTYTNTGAKDYGEFVDNTATNSTITIKGEAVDLAAPFDMYATYAMGTHYIKRGNNTYIFCETEEQANSIKQDGDILMQK